MPSPSTPASAATATTTTAGLPRLLVRGDEQHGVVRYAREIAEAVAARVGTDLMVRGGPGPADDAALVRHRRLHVHFTDGLWGAGPEQAADRFAALAARVPCTVTLHDLPQASDGPANHPRRAAAYRRVARAARGVACSSAHEQELLADLLEPADGVRPVMIEHLVRVHPPVTHRPDGDGDVVVLGFVYPGKGHREALDAVAALPGPRAARPGVVALGRPSAGHEREVVELEGHAARSGVRFSVTGWLDEAALLRRCRAASVPLAAHRHVSASGSIATWVGAGRRPLVPDGRHARQVARARPGTMAVYPHDTLPAAITAALADPGGTWWGPGADPAPGPADTAAAYVAWWRDAVAW